MRMRRLIHRAPVCGAWLLCSAAVAQATPSPRPTLAQPPVVTQQCAACHAPDGIRTATGVPRLAGQNADYLMRQLLAFAAQGRQRANGVMGAIAVNLSEQQMSRAAEYYASQPLHAPALPPAAPRDEQRRDGERIYFDGVPREHVDSCASCHGVDAAGLSRLFPRLAGQHRAYLAAQLRDFRAGRRTTDPDAMMRRVARPLSDQQIDAVSVYLANLR